MRAPYTCRAKFFRDSDVEGDLVWYPARADAPVLPFPSVFTDLIWDYDPWDADGPGPIPQFHIRRNFERVNPLALGTHVCGTAEDFANGGLYQPDDPPVVYLPSGLPECCLPIYGGTGGGMGSGRADVTATPLYEQGCSHAQIGVIGDTYDVTLPMPTTDGYFWRFPVAYPNTYYVHVLDALYPDTVMVLDWGAACFDFQHIGNATVPCAGYTVPSAYYGYLYVFLGGTGSGDARFQFRVDQIPC